MQYCSINYQITPEKKALISINERGFLFGDGVFETCRFSQNNIYNFHSHLNRLKLGLEAIKIDFDLSDLEENIKNLIAKNDLNEGLTRIYISRGQGSSGYDPNENIKPLIIIQTKKLPKKPSNPINLWVSKYKKISNKSLPIHYKLAAQGLNSTLVKLEAKENNCFDGILLDENNNICETSCANIFWVKNQTLFTPSKNCDILFGTIREKILQLAQEKNIQTKEVETNLDEILEADEVFITNISYKILKINSILPKNKIFKNHEIFDILDKNLVLEN